MQMTLRQMTLRQMTLRQCALLAVTVAAMTVAAMTVAGAAAQAQSGPADLVRTYQAGLLATMKRAKALGYSGRVKALEPVVAKAYDLPYLARRAAGRFWRQFSADQKARYVKAFAALSVSSHATRFKGFSGESFRTLGVDDPGRGYRLVRTEVVQPGKENVKVAYLTQQRGGSWKIIDVFLKGTISEVATRRAEFSAVLRDKGIDALIRDIQRKVAEAGGG
jgi:phospholipid transport system substrate-binding protein